MKKSKILLCFVTIILICSIAMILSACNLFNNDDNNHTHTYATEWSYDDEYHWHQADCGHSDLYTDKEEHSFTGGKCTKCKFDADSSKTYKTIIFDVNGGDNEIENMRFAVGEVMSNLPIATRDGYNFVCWVDKYDRYTEYGFSSIMPNEDLTLLAKWEVKLTSYKDDYISFKPATRGYKSYTIYDMYRGDVDEFVYVEITSDNLNGRVGQENNFNLRTIDGMEYRVNQGYTWAWYQGSFDRPNGAQRFTLNYGSNIQFITISDTYGVVQCTYLLDIYVRHDYYMNLYTSIFDEEPYTRVRVIENDRFSADTTIKDIGFEFDSRVYFNDKNGKYEKFVYSTPITKSWNLYQTYKDVEITADLDGGTFNEKLIVKPYSKYFCLPSPQKNGYDFLGWQMPNGKYLTNIQGYSGENYISTNLNPNSLKAVYAEKQYYFDFDGEKLVTKHTVPVVTYSDSTMGEILEIVYTPFGYDCSIPTFTPNTNNFVFKEWQQYYLNSDNEFSESLSTFDFNVKITKPLALIPMMEYNATSTIPIGTKVTFNSRNTYKMYLPVAERYVLKISTTGTVKFTLNSYGNTSAKDYTATSSSPQTINLDYYVYEYGANKYSKGYVTFTVNSLSGEFSAELVGKTGKGANNAVKTNQDNFRKVGEEFSYTFNKTGYVFNGWYDDNTKVTADLTINLTMSVEEKQYIAKCDKITIETSNTNCSSVNSINKVYKSQDYLDLSTEYKLLGYQFKGWYKGNILISNDMSCTITLTDSGNTYIAKWEVDEKLTNFNFTSTKTTLTINSAKDKNITNLEIPNYVTEITKSAFGNCSNLTSITLPFVGGSKTENRYLGYIFGASSYENNNTYIPSSLKEVIMTGGTSIGRETFYGCNKLTSITIPNSVTSIGSSAFYSCIGLTSITIPNSVTSIGSSAFYRYSSNLTSITLPFVGGSKTENRYLGYIFGASSYQDNETYIPSSLKEVIITGGTSIGREAFYSCKGLTNITIPDSVTSIGEFAFSYCRGLTSITIPNSVKSIGGAAFRSCIGLTSITIPNSVTSIGGSAFYECKGLTSITIPNSVTSIGGSAFYECKGLTSITIPDSVKSIGYSAFSYCSGLTNITIPDGVTSIEHSTFWGCSGLTSITIPNSVTSIGYSAFSYCSGLTNITIPDGVTSIEHSAFQNCSGLTSITIPNSVTSIGYSAFQNCSGLTSITIPDNVTSIGSSAFSGCSSLTSITLPFVGVSRKTSTNTYQYPFGFIFGTDSYDGGVSTCQYYYGADTTKTTYTFYYIPSGLKEVTITGGNILYGAFYGCSGLTSITIPDNVDNIGGRAFYYCSSLTSITIPDSVTSISSSAFDGCSSLTSIVVDDKNQTYKSETNCLLSKDGTLLILCCKTSIIPNSVTSIGYRAFKNCSGLTSITIPNSVTSIGESAFDGCSGLTSITLPFVGGSKTENRFLGYLFGASRHQDNENYIPSSLKEVIITGGTSIGDYAFDGCSGLTSITIPNSVTSIGNYAFDGCSGLTSITIPNSVTSIGNYAFDGCSGLKTINFDGTIAEWNSIKKNLVWNGNTGNYTIVCTDGSISK